MPLNTYSTGTVSVAANGTTVTGVGSLWTGVNARAGDLLQIGDFQTIISDVTDALHLSIPPWGGGAASAQPYTIFQSSPLRFAGGQAMVDVSTLVAAINSNGFYVAVPPTATVPDPSLGEENQYAIQAGTGKVWQRTGGAWVLVATLKGFGTMAPWSATTAYAERDVVSLGGSSYVCILANTNQAPPSASWMVLAAKGDTGTGATVAVGTVATGASGSAASVTNVGTPSAAVLNFSIPQGLGYGGTSTTSLAIATGSKVFTTQAGLAYQVGTYVRASSTAGGANFMEGPVTAYSGTSLTINVTKIGGSGTLASWSFAVGGAPGTGDLLSTNNLSELTNKTTAIDNLSVKGADIASAATLNLDSATGNFVHVTGTTAITAITLTSGRQRTVYFTGALTLTNGGSLVLPGGANISTAAGDIAVFVADGTTVRCTDYTLANGQSLSLAAAAKTDQQAATSAALAVTPLHQQDHDSAVKAWAIFDSSSTPVIASKYNIASIVKTGTGAFTINFTVPFASANYVVQVTPETTSFNGWGQIVSGSRTASSVKVQFITIAGPAAFDPVSSSVSCYGRQ